MKTMIKKSLQGLLLVPALLLGVSTVMPATSSDIAQAQISSGIEATGGTTSGSGGTADGVKAKIKQATDALLFVVGAASVIMIIYGGFKYVTSGGDSSGVTSAKNTILYAVIGLVVAALAFVIVDFVYNQTTDAGASSVVDPRTE